MGTVWEVALARIALRRTAAALLVLTALGSCGGGSGGSPQPAPPANTAPSFTSPATLSVSESAATGTVYTAAASDLENDALSFSIVGGADAARFAITSAGALRFAAAPDFENPADANGDNVYQIQLQVSDGRATATLALTVTVTNDQSGQFRVRRVATGFAAPLHLTAVPDGSGRVFVVQQGGLIRILTPSTGAIAATPFLDLTGQISTDGERGLLGLALAPDFATTGIFYVFVTNPGGDIEIRRYRTLANDRGRADAATGDVLIQIEHSAASNHNGGWIDFGPDGFLYAAVGDGGGSGDPANNAQNRDVLLGKMLRLDVSADGFPNDPLRDYRIPATNPFVNGGGAPEIWAFGLRNPFRNSFDRVTGNLWIGDVGQGAVEEIDLMRPGDGGANFGWAVLEGTRPFRGEATATMVPPVTEYAHGAGPREGNSVTGGYVYRGPVEALQGLYIFGDFVRGAIWSVPIAQLTVGATLPSSQFTVRTQEFAPNAGAIGNIASFGQDQAGNLYIVDIDGEVFVIEPA